MGQAISNVEFGKGGLDFTRGNEGLLTELSKQIEALVQNNPREAEVPFKKPFVWNTRLTTADFTGNQYFEDGGEVKSADKKADGTPLLNYASGELSVHNFVHMGNVLKFAKEKRLREISRGLEANPNPIANIMGPAYSQAGSNLLEIHDKILKQQGESNTAAEDQASFRLLMLLNAIDVKLLHASVAQMTKDVRINMASVTAEVELLGSFAGLDDHHCLQSVDWESAYVHSNGHRSPPWRQVHGDLAYIAIVTAEGDHITVLANVDGFWQIKGMESNTMNYDKVGETFPTLVALMKDRSDKFAENVDKQEFRFQEDKNQQQVNVKDFLESSSNPPIHTSNKGNTTKSNKKDTRKQKQEDAALRRSLKPSHKWANLGLDTTGTLKKTTQKSETKRKPKSAISNKSRKTSAQPPPVQLEESDSDDDGDEEDLEEHRLSGDLPSEYWSIQKLVKYLSGGNQTATIISLCSLRDFDLSSDICQFAIRDVGGLDVLVNLLETDDTKCQIGALKILREVSVNPQINRALADLEAVRPLVNILDDQVEELQCLAAETLAHCTTSARNRQMTRAHGGVEKLVALLRHPGSADGKRDVARCGALALCSCSKSRRNQKVMIEAGAIPLLADLLAHGSEEEIIPVVGTLVECASQEASRLLIRQAGMIPDLVAHLGTENMDLKIHSSCAIFRCAEDPDTRTLVREHQGLSPLVDMLTRTDQPSLLWGATGALWKCAQDPLNVKILAKTTVVANLAGLLSNQEEDVLINVAGALGELCRDNAEVRKALRSSGGIDPLVKLLTGTNQDLLVNVTFAVGQSAKDHDNMSIVDKLDGVRLLWSLLKSPNQKVQANAAWAICPCLANAKDAGELVRSFVGGLELVVGLLKSDNIEVVASICAAIAQIAVDQENLAVVTDHGVVSMLSSLVETRDDLLRRHLADAIAQCCGWGSNRAAFGEEEAVAPLVAYLKSKDKMVHRSVAKALHQLSKHPDNCVIMHEAGVVQLLLAMVGSEDEILQEASASCLGNIRRLALANEKVKYS
eukprot:m.102085 g.102085  ORF g.102085 m.102085 type:complete len:1027 (-) comp22316_c0_seq2:122-3202(-)